MILILSVTVANAENQDARHYSAAYRYAAITKIEAIVRSSAIKIVTTLPEENRGDFIAYISNEINYKELEKSYINLLVKHFTTDELNSLSDYYSSQHGKSVMNKMGGFMTELQPIVFKIITMYQSRLGSQ
jgi:hypothetical protein